MPLLNFAEAAARARHLGLSLPAPSPHDGRYLTMNETGGMHPKLTSTDEKFLVEACQPSAKVVEIGPAYGLLCMEALHRGSGHYTAVDTDERHLLILAREIEEKLKPRESLTTTNTAASLRLVHGSFPSGDGVLEALRAEAPYDAIIAAQVFHFMKEADVRPAFDAFHELLKPGGCLFVTTNTTHLVWFREEVRAELDKQVAEWLAACKPPNQPLPGFLSNMRQALDEDKFAELNLSPDDFNLTRDHCFLFDKAVMEHMVEDRNKWDTPLTCDYMERPKDVWADSLRSARDRILLIVRKKVKNKSDETK